MSTFSVKGKDIDVEAIMATIRKRVGEKRKGLYSEQEVREVAEMKLDSILDASDFNSDFVNAFRARDEQWNYTFQPETIYESSRGVSGVLIRVARSIMQPFLKMLFNPNPIISALSRQSDLNRFYVSLLHNMTVEMTKMNLEVSQIKARMRSMGIRVDTQTRREKTLEEMTVNKPGANSSSNSESANRRRSRGGRRPWRRRRGGRSEGGDDKRRTAPETQGAGQDNSGSGKSSD